MFTSLFAFRIVAQPLSLVTAHPALPAFEAYIAAPQTLHICGLPTGRFHPLEKLLQISVSSTPLLVFGAEQEVISVYFVFYALHGFLQHCNIDLKLGVLNFLFSGPEQRWFVNKPKHESQLCPGSHMSRLSFSGCIA